MHESTTHLSRDKSPKEDPFSDNRLFSPPTAMRTSRAAHCTSAASVVWTLLTTATSVLSEHQQHENVPFERIIPPSMEYWQDKYGPQIDQPFSGPLSFSHLPYFRCLEESGLGFDIAVLGLPFDTAVSYRPGARFGPHAIRAGSRRQRPIRGYTLAWGTNPYVQGSDIIDCGDVPVSPFDNVLALDQIEVAYSTLLARPVRRNDSDSLELISEENLAVRHKLKNMARDRLNHPRIVR